MNRSDSWKADINQVFRMRRKDKKPPVRFNADKDIALLKIVLSSQFPESGVGWDAVALQLRHDLGLPVGRRRVKERTNLLLRKYRAGELNGLQCAGSPEECLTRESLVEQLHYQQIRVMEKNQLFLGSQKMDFMSDEDARNGASTDSDSGSHQFSITVKDEHDLTDMDEYLHESRDPDTEPIITSKTPPSNKPLIKDIRSLSTAIQDDVSKDTIHCQTKSSCFSSTAQYSVKETDLKTHNTTPIDNLLVELRERSSNTLKYDVKNKLDEIFQPRRNQNSHNIPTRNGQMENSVDESITSYSDGKYKVSCSSLSNEIKPETASKNVDKTGIKEAHDRWTNSSPLDNTRDSAKEMSASTRYENETRIKFSTFKDGLSDNIHLKDREWSTMPDDDNKIESKNEEFRIENYRPLYGHYPLSKPPFRYDPSREFDAEIPPKRSKDSSSTHSFTSTERLPFTERRSAGKTTMVEDAPSALSNSFIKYKTARCKPQNSQVMHASLSKPKRLDEYLNQTSQQTRRACTMGGKQITVVSTNSLNTEGAYVRYLVDKLELETSVRRQELRMRQEEINLLRKEMEYEREERRKCMDILIDRCQNKCQ